MLLMMVTIVCGPSATNQDPDQGSFIFDANLERPHMNVYTKPILMAADPTIITS